MRCTVVGCDKTAAYRTLGDSFVAFVCLKHMEEALDSGWPAERLISIPKKAS